MGPRAQAMPKASPQDERHAAQPSKEERYRNREPAVDALDKYVVFAKQESRNQPQSNSGPAQPEAGQVYRFEPDLGDPMRFWPVPLTAVGIEEELDVAHAGQRLKHFLAVIGSEVVNKRDFRAGQRL